MNMHETVAHADNMYLFSEKCEENEITKNYFQSQSEIFIDQCVCVWQV